MPVICQLCFKSFEKRISNTHLKFIKIMLNKPLVTKIYKIWDAGHDKFIWNKKGSN